MTPLAASSRHSYLGYEDLVAVQAGPEGGDVSARDMFEGQEEVSALEWVSEITHTADTLARPPGAQGLVAQAAGLHGEGHNVAHERPGLHHGT